MNKTTFLLEHSFDVPLKKSIGKYDAKESMNIGIRDGERIPLIILDGGLPTNSKTLADPGDDDPDPGQERCY